MPSLPVRRVRATFWLRCVIFAVCLAPLVFGLQVGMSGAWMIVAFVIVAVLPPGIELVLVGLAARSRGSLSPIWFLDVERQHRQALQDFHDDTNDNPTLR